MKRMRFAPVFNALSRALSDFSATATQASMPAASFPSVTRSLPQFARRLAWPAAAAAAFVATLSLPVADAQAATSPASPRYALAGHYMLSGAEGWDYLGYEPARRRLFISRANHVQVIDADTGKLVGDIPNTDGVHGFAFVEQDKLGFITNGRANTITVFDLDTLKTTATLAAGGPDPDSILYVPELGRIYVSNGHDNSVSAFDVATQKLVATLPVGGKPETLSAGTDGRVYVAVEDKGEIAAIDGKQNTVIAHWPMSNCEEPSGLVIDPDSERLFAVCSNGHMAVVDAHSGRQVATVPIGAEPDSAAFDPLLKTVFSPNGKDGTLTVVHEDSPDHYSVRQTLATQRGARTVALDRDDHRLFLVSSKFGPAPAPTAAEPHPRPVVIDGTFNVLVVKPAQ
jgi:YVTN family beta-propeller protein